MLILASNSQRRRDLLRQVGINFEIISPNFSEILLENEKAEKAVLRFAREKALEVANKNPKKVVLAADTLGDFQGEILKKPKDLEEAFLMLKKLAGHSHKIFTAFTIIHKEKNLELSVLKEAEVLMRPFDERRIRNYLNTNESLDKAGAYAIQGYGAILISKLKGDFYTVVGLPLFEVISALEKFEIYPLN